jgi:ATP-dependent 26S proteasome regulatory subunit
MVWLPERGIYKLQASNCDPTVVDVAESVDISKLTPGKRVTLLSDSYRLERILPSSVRNGALLHAHLSLTFIG